MQLALFEECSLDDESGKCKQLTEAMEAMAHTTLTLTLTLTIYLP